MTPRYRAPAQSFPADADDRIGIGLSLAIIAILSLALWDAILWAAASLP